MALLAAASLLGAGCANERVAGPAAASPSAPELVAQVASYDLAIGSPTRFMVGLVNKEGAVATGGQVSMRFSYLGPKGSKVAAQQGPTAEGVFLPIPAEGGDHGHGPAVAGPPQGVGVFAASVPFDKPGLWKVAVGGRAGGRASEAEASFEVAAAHKVPAPGAEAPRSENLTVGSPNVSPAAIDSRATSLETIPDPELHRTTVREAIDAQQPVLVLVSTPTYCVSRFCGPITDMVSDLAKQYEGKAAFVHLEVWRDRQANSINKAAAEWVLRDGDLTEPWVFFVGGDGKVTAGWDNVATRGEVEPALQALP